MLVLTSTVHSLVKRSINFISENNYFVKELTKYLQISLVALTEKSIKIICKKIVSLAVPFNFFYYLFNENRHLFNV